MYADASIKDEWDELMHAGDTDKHGYSHGVKVHLVRIPRRLAWV